jgi:GPH family glycoside/pentoside/hexuronide:cation symporter
MTAPWFEDQKQGAASLAIIIAVVVIGIGILPAIFLRERFKEEPGSAREKKTLGQSMAEFFTGFKLVLQSKPFVLLCVATFLVFNGFMLISSFQFYVIIYYVFGGDQLAGAEYAGYAGTAQAVGLFVVVILATWLGTKLGKKRAFYLSTAVSMIGYGLKWFCYNPDFPLLVILPSPLMAFGLGGLFTLMPAMVADVVDLDELSTHERREGMFGSIYWWVVKLGMAAALAGGGYLLNATGFDVALEGNQAASTITLLRLFDAFIPMAASGIAIWAVARYPLTEAKAREVREKLEQRRGKLGAESAPVPA